MRQNALFQLGMDLGTPSTSRKEAKAIATPKLVKTDVRAEERDDHFVVRNGVRCAGAHLIIDLYGADRLDDIDHIDETLRRCVAAANATLLHIHLHHFEPNGGISGVAVLAESHISVHTWPEKGYAAFDVFMCGDAEPRKAMNVFKRAFNPGRIVIGEHKRGVL